MAISRTREYAADSGGSEISGKPLGLAAALEKISGAGHHEILKHLNSAHAHMFIANPLQGVRGLSHLSTTHPPMEERVWRLSAMAAAGR